MTIPIIARHTRDIDGRPLIEIDAIGRRITFCAELSAAELRELARQLVAIANDADHDRIVAGLRVQVEQLTAERARWVENAEAKAQEERDQLEERCRELEEEARAPLCFCGMPMAKNTHPDAGKPGQLLEVGAVYVCIPCLSKANHGHAKSANALRAEVERLQRELATAHADASHYASTAEDLRAEGERLKPLLKEAGEELKEMKESVGYRAHTLDVIQRIDAALDEYDRAVIEAGTEPSVK